MDHKIDHKIEYSLHSSPELSRSQVPKLYESVTQYEVVVPRIVPKHRDIVIPLFVPRFVEACQIGESDSTGLQQFGLTREDVDHEWTVEFAEPLFARAFEQINKARVMGQPMATQTNIESDKSVAGAKLLLQTEKKSPPVMQRLQSPTPPAHFGTASPKKTPINFKSAIASTPRKTIEEQQPQDQREEPSSSSSERKPDEVAVSTSTTIPKSDYLSKDSADGSSE